MDELVDQYAAISLEEEESGGISYPEDETFDGGIDTKWCLVGRFLSDRVIDFEKMQHSLASLWKPGKGVYIRSLEPNLFLFQFYHEVDISRVIEGSPWTYDRMQLVFERLNEGDNPRMLQINKLDFWVQLHDIQPGFMTERVCKDVGNYIGKFLDSDKNNFTGVWRDYLRIRVRILVDKPLKQRMKIKKLRGEWFQVNFKYEHVPTFCFICGLLGHAEKFCAKVFEVPANEITRPYGPWMKAMPRRQHYLGGSKWLRTGSSWQQSEKDRSMDVNGTVMDEDDNRKSGIENQDPNCKGYGAKIVEENVPTENKEGNKTNSNPVNTAISMDEDPEYIFNDPKRKRPNIVTENPIQENIGLTKNLQAAGLNAGVCRDQ